MYKESRYQTLVFSLDSYTKTNLDISQEQARELMWKDIGDFLYLLTKNKYVAVVYDDDVDIIVIQYEHDEKADPWGGPYPYWITQEEAWFIEDSFDTSSENVEEE